MTKNTSIFVTAAVAGILVAGALVVAMPAPVRADQYGGFNHQRSNGGNANGGDGGQANGGNICNHVKAIKSKVGGELCGSS